MNIANASDVRTVVMDAWERTLEVPPADDAENFFDAGGNSILLVTFQQHLSRGLGRKVALSEIFREPTVAGIAYGLAAGREGESAEASVRVSGAGPARLYCLPYAGASARMYDVWKDALPPSVELVPLELPGRGSRCGRRPIATLPELLSDLSSYVADDGVPYAVFGHSFGGILAYELAQHLAATGRGMPSHLLVSGCRAPWHARPAQTSFDLSDQEFRDRLAQLRGTPQELLENDELMELYLPIIRADYMILDRYEPTARGPLTCPIVAFYGEADADATEQDVVAWADCTTSKFRAEAISGDHFFLHSAKDDLVRAIGAHLVPGSAQR
ncbi:alpha/beta fold hydrolase [Streptomyces sp. NPDC054794]